MNARLVRKTIGVVLMLCGFLPLIPFVLYFCLAFLDATTKEQWEDFGVFALGLSILVLVRMRRLSWPVFWATLLCVFTGYLGFCRYGTAQGILAGYGIHYDNDPNAPPFASPGLSAARFWFDGPDGRLAGPSLIIEGAAYSVERPYHTSDGHLEFAVRSRTYPSSPTRIQLLLPPENDRAFRVVASGATATVDYPFSPQASSP